MLHLTFIYCHNKYALVIYQKERAVQLQKKSFSALKEDFSIKVSRRVFFNFSVDELPSTPP